MNILCVGNSFSRDTVEHIHEIAKNAGMTSFRFANLYIGGCSINRHYQNATENLADYRYSETTGGPWEGEEMVSIADALKKGPWDIISIQHGTGDKSRYTSPESYVNLPALIEYIKDRCDFPVRLVFNMAWVADPESKHHEISSYGGDQLLMYENLTKVTKDVVAPLVDAVSPAGTAIQNLRTCMNKKLTRDNFHLSYDLGRFTAGLTFLHALTDLDLEQVVWAPEGVTEEERDLAKIAASLAVKNNTSVQNVDISSLQGILRQNQILTDI